MEGVGAHDHHAVGEVAEDAAGIFARNLRLPPGALRVAQLRSVEGVGIGFLDGDHKPSKLTVIALHDAVQFLTTAVLLPQIGNGGVAHLPLGQVNVISPAFHKAAPGADGQYTALDPCPTSVQGGLGGEVIAARPQGDAAGGNGLSLIHI